MRKIDLELIRPIWLPFSFTEEENCRKNLKNWLTDGYYYHTNANPSLLLIVQDEEEIKKCFSLDAFRFVTHAVQTIYEMEKTTAYTKLTSWRVIQTYYAAYFAAHAVLRFFGKSFSYFDPSQVKFLKRRCESELGYIPDLPSSYYLIEFDAKKRSLDFLKFDESHKDLWQSYKMLLKDLEQKILNARASNERRQELSNRFSDMIDFIANNDQYKSGNWLSVMRNDVNYKSLKDVWFPFSKRTPQFSDLLRTVRDWRNCSDYFTNPKSARSDLERFFLTSFSVIDFSIAISLDYRSLVKKRAGKRSGDFVRLLNDSNA